MVHSWFCVLLLLNTLIYCGHSQDLPRASVKIVSPQEPLYSGERITLQCYIPENTDWTYVWKRNSQLFPIETSKTTTIILPNNAGQYQCQGKRTDQPQSSYISPNHPISVTAPPTASVSVSPQGLLYAGETVTLQCDISNYTDWTYWWYRKDQLPSPGSPSKTISTLSDQVSQYQCHGRRTDRPQSSQRSVSLHISVTDQSKAVLSISPQWMNPGDSVTLNCKVKESSTGWRFSWYKTVPYRAGLPSLLDKSYSVETLSGYGTTEESYTLSPAGPTDTGGYVCRAGRGDPVYYTDYSEPQFLWSGDLQSSVSVRINPNRTQHFTSKSLSLTCDLKGNSTGWRLMRYTETGVESGCSPNWRSITGSTCTITSTDTGDSGVYWCESGSGQYSNAVNITVSVLPSGCSTSVLVRVVGGLVVAAVLLTILFLLCQYKKKKDSCSNRRFWPVHPQGTNQDPQQDQGSTQVQSPDAGFTGNDNIYNMMNLSGNIDNDSAGVSAVDGSGDVTYAQIQPKRLDKKEIEKPADPNENRVHSEMKTMKTTASSGPVDVTYAEIDLRKMIKTQKKKKSTTLPESESVYSPVKTARIQSP
ncbi:obscurin-like [Esox lucius]|uniref:obscurin-like n=1 Tax=Esox lucius TaxID=8010 RepID=UPI0014770868|nr:obscurin-like [Esox lucius]